MRHRKFQKMFTRSRVWRFLETRRAFVYGFITATQAQFFPNASSKVP